MLDLQPKKPIKDLVSALEQNMKPKATVVIGTSAPRDPMPLAPSKHDHDKEMVLNRLRAINRTSQILEKMACGCEPMPSWAESKIYTAAKDLQSVLGYLLGDKPL